MKSIGRIIKAGTQLRHKREETPEGIAWVPSQRAIKEGGVTLRLSGVLRNSYSFLADHASVRIGTNVIYAGIHHHGGKAGRKTKPVLIVARPALGASEADNLEIVETMNDYIGGAWNR
jgi:phage virion morphogenesis protein